MKKYMAVVCFLSAACFADVTVTNLTVAQRPGTKLVDIIYDVSSTTTNTVTISLTVSNGTSAVMATNLTGAVGAGVSIGTGKSMIWDMGADWSTNVASLSFSVWVSDDSLLPMCPVPKSGQTTSYQAGDDGDLELGIAWPNPRFTIVTNGADLTVTDNLTGLEWIKAPHALPGNSSSKSWNSAIDFCNSLVYAGKSDWRLPSRKELMSLIDYGRYSPALPAGNPFVGVQNGYYWSGTSYANQTNYAWPVSMSEGSMDCYSVGSGFGNKSGSYYVWAVRGEVAIGVASVPKSGQTVIYRTGDDGDIQPGVLWPNPRFTVITNGTAVTVLDNLTGLEWIKAPHSLAGNANATYWSEAITFCASLSYAGNSDWRLPSVRELESLVSCKDYSPALPAGHPFVGVKNSLYWSSSSRLNWAGYNAWLLGMLDGALTAGIGKNEAPYYIWPVRSSSPPTTGENSVTLADTRNYVLSVTSAYGAPAPSVGTNLYAWASIVTCSVQSAVSGDVNSICEGWLGTGSVPASGTTNTTGAIVLTNLNSSIMWFWPVKTIEDLRALNVSASQRPGTKLVDISYDLQSTKTNRADVSLAVLSGTNAVTASSVSGAVGSTVTTGAAKTVVWDAGADWNGNLDNLTFRILGQDAQGAGTTTPAGRVRIPAGENTGTDSDFGAYSLTVSNSFFMDAGEVTKAQWDAVYNWALTNGYSFDNAGSATDSNHPVQTINWTDAAKWCNARSQMEGFVPCYSTNDWSCDVSVNGYRLPTSAEWQYAARGGLSGKRFPWGDTITHSNDTYYSSTSYAYDVSTTRGFHPLFGIGTAPAGSGTTNGYGLTEMSGNVMEWCNDLSGANRVLAGGSWDQYASEARCAYTSQLHPANADVNIGFRTVQRASSSASAETGSAVPVDTRDYLLTVQSTHGSPVPNIGTNMYAWRASVTGSVNSSVTSGLTNWTSAGWSGSGSVPVSGSSTNTGNFTLTSLVSSIVWSWNTNYWIEAATNGAGRVTGGNRWVASGSNATVSANPSNGWLFMGWSGDVSRDCTATNIIIPMVRPVSITATFSNDADDDGLLNTNETALGTDPRHRDSDEDGMNDAQELIAGTFPTNAASVLDIQFNSTGSANELTWYGVSGRFYQLEYTDVLASNWIPKGTVITGANAPITKLDINPAAGRFYRIRVSVSSITGEAFSYYPRLTSVAVPFSAASIESMAFIQCTSLINVTIPGSVTNIGNEAFSGCTSLLGVHFMGNAPVLGSNVFLGDNQATVFYLPGTANWGATFGGRPTALWMTLMIIR
jgi:formylglycine-generating enzyme required for sulfatase activity